MKKYFAGILTALAVIAAAFAGFTVYDSLTVDWPVKFTGLPLDGQYPDVSIDGSGNLYKTEIVAASAYLSGTQDLVTTGADTYYAIPGPFVNNLLENFTLSGDSIVYNGPDTYILIFYTTSVESDTNNTTVTANVLINGVECAGCLSKAKIESTTSSQSMSAISTYFASSGDSIQLVLKSDKAGATITFDSYSTIALRF